MEHSRSHALPPSYPPSEVDFRVGFRPQLDDVMVRQLERLLHQYRGARPRALRFGTPAASAWGASTPVANGQLGGLRIALRTWASAQVPVVQWSRSDGRSLAAKLTDILDGLTAATADGGGGQLERVNRLI